MLDRLTYLMFGVAIGIMTAMFVVNANAQNTNSWQPLAPFGAVNYAARIDGLADPIFYAPLVNSTSASMGASTAGTFSRASSMVYWSDASTPALSTTGNPAYGQLSGAGDGSNGFIALGAKQNYILQSEAPATTWAQSGTPSSVTNSIGTWGVIDFGIIATDAVDEGIEQVSSLAAASKWISASVLAESYSGTVGYTLTLEDQTGTPVGTSTNCTATTTVSPCSVYYAFGAGAVGNAEMRITVDDASTVLKIGGMMMERTDSGTGRNGTKIRSGYVPTTTSTATTANNVLYWGSTNMSNVLDTGTVVVWVKMPRGCNDKIHNGYADYIFNMKTSELQMNHGGDSAAGSNCYAASVYNGDYADTTTASGVKEFFDFDYGEWHMLSLTWDHDGSDVTRVAYFDTTKAYVDVATVAEMTAGNIYLGDGGANDRFPGGPTNELRIYDWALGDSEIAMVYNATSGSH